MHDPYVDAAALAGLAEQVEQDVLLRRSRIVSLHARATPRTNGIVGREQIAVMPAGSVIVNCARGSLLDYDDLCDALDARHLLAAAVDVYPDEPIPADSRLLRTAHLVKTPQLAGATAANAADIVAADAAPYLRGAALRYPANRPVTGR